MARGVPLPGPLPCMATIASITLRRGARARCRSSSMSAKSARSLARTWSWPLRRPVTQPKVSLTAPVRRMSRWVLSGPTWTMPSASVQQRPPGSCERGGLRERRARRRRCRARAARHPRRGRPPPCRSPRRRGSRGVRCPDRRGCRRRRAWRRRPSSARSTARSVSGWVVTTFSGGAARSRLTLTPMRSPGLTSAPKPPKGAQARSRAAGRPGPYCGLDVADDAGDGAAAGACRRAVRELAWCDLLSFSP